MIEAAEFATPYQRKLYEEHRQIHRKFAAAVEPPSMPRWRDMVQHRSPAPAPPMPAPLAVKGVGIEETAKRMKIIRRIVCETFCINREALLSAQRRHSVVFPRHVYVYLASRLTKASLPQIGKSLGQDHTTILHAIRRMKIRVMSNPEICARIEAIESRIKNEFGLHDQPYRVIGKYVAHHNVADYLMIGWTWSKHITDHGVLMVWPCGCNCVEPRE